MTPEGTCKACNESIPNCLSCPTLNRCSQCKEDFFPNLHQTECMLPIDSCEDDPENYGNDGVDYVCNNCPYEHYWSSNKRSCEECPEEMLDSGCTKCGQEGTICFECIGDATLNPTRTSCIDRLENCDVEPKDYIVKWHSGEPYFFCPMCEPQFYWNSEEREC